MSTRTVSYRLRDYLGDGFTEDMADPVYAALQDTAWTADGDDAVTAPMPATDPRARVFAASPAIETEVRS